MSDVVERSITLKCDLERAFETFTARIDAWWPRSHRRFGDESVLEFEPEVGGRMVERNAAGDERVFGEVLEWAPPTTLRYTWTPGADDGPTEVLVRFVPIDDGATRVEIEHTVGRSNPATWPERMRLFENGWDAVLPGMGRLDAT